MKGPPLLCIKCPKITAIPRPLFFQSLKISDKNLFLCQEVFHILYCQQQFCKAWFSSSQEVEFVFHLSHLPGCKKFWCICPIFWSLLLTFCLPWKVKCNFAGIETNCNKIKLGRKLFSPLLHQRVACLISSCNCLFASYQLHPWQVLVQVLNPTGKSYLEIEQKWDKRADVLWRRKK